MSNLSKKLIIVILIFSLMLTFFPRSARAGAWGEDYGAAILKQTLEEIYLKIKETIVASLKMAAIRVIQSRLSSLLGGNSGSSSLGISGFIISDWRQFIYGTANNYSMKITNNFFSNIQSGVPSPLTSRIITPAQRAVMSNNIMQPPNLQNYISEGRADRIFSSGFVSNPWRVWDIAGQPQNDVGDIYLRASTLREISYNEEAEKQKAEGIAGGGVKSKEAGSSSSRGPYTATTSSGGKVTVPPGSNYTGAQQITTPGSVIKDMIGEIQSMPVKMVSLARSIPEIVAGMVTQMITQMINQGIVMATSKINSTMSNIK
jgi:hypothetical protein